MPDRSIDPASGRPFGPEFPDTTADELKAILAAAAVRSAPSPRQIASTLREIAAAVDDRGTELVVLAQAETALGEKVLSAELQRTTYQLRWIADLVAAGEAVDPRLDPAATGPPPAGHPELWRAGLPVGPVAVFGASNFPFAFGVIGGDTAAALGAGCPVVVKAHPAHPQLSEAIAGIVAAATNSDRGAFTLMRGTQTARLLVLDSRVRAVALTGSTAGGRALFDLAVSRPDPIPFYGELGSVNPILATESVDPHSFVTGWVDSLLIRGGQMCTNPGIVVAPRLLGLGDASRALLAERAPVALLAPGIAAGYMASWHIVAGIEGAVTLLVPSRTEPGSVVTAGLVNIDASSALAELAAVQTECFGPAGVLIEYEDPAEALALAERLHGSLVAGVHGAPDDDVASELVERLARRAGRLVWNEWPTGVAVSPAQHHGGPYPAATYAGFSSVGGNTMARFVRPVAFQSLPPELLPACLNDFPTGSMN